MSRPLSYRPDIDGLRAVAVLPVILFHAGIPGFTGGYVGVDVFFVISGFLITSMIHDEMTQGRFSIVKFYERRIRRIFPALFVVLAASSVAACAVLAPADLKDFGQSLFATATFSSNVLFWMQTDYFDGPAHLKPLLHTWSLAVEEQFYIIYPLALGLLLRLWRAFAGRVLFMLLGLSLACAWLTMLHSPATAFYHLPQRGWELLVGCMLALGVLPHLRRAAVREAVAGLGLVLIGASACFYSDTTAFPGIAALVPCLGAGMVIYAGRDGASSVVGAFLSRPLMVFLGKISYSLYLWHWPLLVFGGYLALGRLGLVEASAVALLSLPLAALSWKFVEQPFRRGAVRTRGRLFGLAAGVSALAIVIGGAMHVGRGFPERVSGLVNSLDAARNDRNPDRNRCHASDQHPIAFADKCVYGVQTTQVSAAIWGDSFAAELAVALGEQAKAANRAMLYVSYSACAPAVDVYEHDRPKCAQHNRDILQRLAAEPAIRDVVLVARHERHVKDYGDDYLESFGAVALALKAAGKNVVVTYPIPKPPAHVPTLLAQYAHLRRDPHAAHIDRQSYDAENAETTKFLDELARREGIHVARPSERLCDADRCELYVGDKVLYFDENHLSLTGARYVLPVYASVFGGARL